MDKRIVLYCVRPVRGEFQVGSLARGALAVVTAGPMSPTQRMGPPWELGSGRFTED